MDPMTREWTLEGGALVLADQGTCLIDEFDKMSDQDRTSIHEAMEQQSISISKAGIVCTLKARCAVIAAANPIGGRYINTKSFQEQVDLTEPILSRFDCLCVVRDIVDPSVDRKLADFVVSSHTKSHPSVISDERDAIDGSFVTTHQRREELAALEAKGQIPQDLLRKYIAYARQHCHPKLHNVDHDKITKLYVNLRKTASNHGGIQITSRQIESLIRMAEAHAKMALRDFVSNEDVDVAIRTMLESFISSQKLSVRTALENKFSEYISRSRDRHELLLDVLKDLLRTAFKVEQNRLGVPAETLRQQPFRLEASDFVNSAARYNVTDVGGFYSSTLFSDEGFTYDSQNGAIFCHFS
jgi:DNA replication licensing factor MCM2